MMAFPIWGYGLEQMQEVAGERGGYLHGRGGSLLFHILSLELLVLFILCLCS
jgi:hypothetical protein